MRTSEFKQFCNALDQNVDDISLWIELCNELEAETGWNLDDVVQSSGKIKRAIEIANSKSFKHHRALEAYFDFALPFSQCKVPLFHGTRRYALEVSKEERERFFAACNKVIAFAKQWRDSGKIDWDKVKEYITTNRRFMAESVVGLYGSPDYQYGDFYLTSSYTNAISFSFNGAGELGEYAYSQCRGFRDFGIGLGEETLAAVRIVEEEYPKYKNSEKVILIFYGVSFADLCSERGWPYSSDVEKLGEEGFESYVKKTLYSRAKDTDSRIRNKNFRLLNRDHYLPLELTESKYRAAFKIFTEIKDVDRFIKYHNSTSSVKWDF